jgi:hypothetical protein
MAAGKILRLIFVSGLKVVIFGAVVYLVCTLALRIQEATSLSSKDICEGVQLGMSVDQIDRATAAFQGWQVLRDDDVMVISTRSYRDKNPVCRIAIDPNTHRATLKSMGPLQQGDWPTL